MKTILSILVALISTSAFANTYVKCGQKANLDTFEVKGYELELSSENDKYTGEVGKNWNLKLGSENSEWLENNKNITASTDKNGVITIFVRKFQTVSGYIGTRYVLTGLYDDQPVLEKYTLGGGIVGPMKVGTLECVSGND
jgi:hypothetical protein